MMLRTFCREHPLASFALLAFTISWLAAIPLILHARSEPAGELPVGWELLNVAGPAFAAIIVAGLVDGGAGIRRLLASCMNPRLPAAAWCWAVGAPIAIFTIAVLVVRITAGEWPALRGAVTGEAGTILSLWLVPALLGALSGPGEEPGWRGYALPKLLERNGPWRATLLLTLLWVPWHLPMFFYRPDFGIGDFALFGFALFCGAIWLTEIHLLAGGIAFAAIAWHSVWNFVAVTARALTPSPFPIMTTCILLGALYVGWRWLRKRPGRTIESAPA